MTKSLLVTMSPLVGRSTGRTNRIGWWWWWGGWFGEVGWLGCWRHNRPLHHTCDRYHSQPHFLTWSKISLSPPLSWQPRAHHYLLHSPFIVSYLPSNLFARHLHIVDSATDCTSTKMATMANHDRATSQPTCQNCETHTTPLWRRDETGAVLCNACGLFLKLHGRPRPPSLKTDVIKSRNRVKTMRPDLAKQKKVRW